MQTKTVFAFALVLTLSCRVWSAPLIQELPEDGSRVKFFVTIDFGGGNEQLPTWIVQSVGQKTVDGETCRWIELIGKDKERTFQVYKVLVAEKEFIKGKNPLTTIREAWSKRGDNDPVKIEKLEAADPILAVVLAGPVKDVKKLDKKEKVNWQKGQFQCDVYVGGSRLEIPGIKIEVSHRVLRHKKVPFGIAAGTLELKGTIGGQSRAAKVKFSVDDLGKDAKPELPDVQ